MGNVDFKSSLVGTENNYGQCIVNGDMIVDCAFVNPEANVPVQPSYVFKGVDEQGNKTYAWQIFNGAGYWLKDWAAGKSENLFYDELQYGSLLDAMAMSYKHRRHRRQPRHQESQTVGSVGAIVELPKPQTPIPVRSMQAGPPENTGWFKLAWEFVSGNGPRERQFGPDSDMTKGLRNSPGVNANRNKFCEGGGRSYRGSASFGPSGLLRAGTNMPRQVVGSYNIAITPQPGGGALFEITNTTHLKSLLYQIPGVQDVQPSEMKALSNKEQTYWWKEDNPCGMRWLLN